MPEGLPAAPVEQQTAVVPAASEAPPPPATKEEPAETYGGLFERSQAAAGAGPAAASDESAGTGGGDAGRAAGPARVTVSGYSRGGVFVGKVPGTRLGEMKAAYGELSMAVKTVRGTYSDYGDGFAEGRLRYGLQGSQQQTVVDLREAFATLYAGRWFDLRLGKQIIVWGRADALNPTNNLMPFDIRVRSPIEDDRRIGNVAARANLHLGPFRVEGVWIPLYIASELPDIPLPKYVYFGPPINQQPELRDGLLAARVHLELPAFEMSASYLRGFAPLPGLQRRSVVLDPDTPEILITRTTDYEQVLGFDFSTALGSLLALRGEAAYRLPADYEHRHYAARPDLQYAVGADHSFGPVSVIGQYLGRYVLDWQREEGAPDADPSSLNMVPSATAQKFAEETIDAELAKKNQMLFGQTVRIQHLVTARIEWLVAHDTVSIALFGLYNFTTREWYAAPKLGYHLSDDLTAYVGGEIFRGPEGTLFGVIDELLSAGYAELRYTY
jgi:hypothetical protein